MQQQKTLLEGDVVIGLNGDTIVNQLLQPAVKLARDSGATTLTFTVLRPKGKVHLAGATVALGGTRKAGGHSFTLNTADGAARRSKYSLVAPSEREFLAWQTSIKEATAAAAMEAIKSTVAQALEEQMFAELKEQRDASKAASARRSVADPDGASPAERTVASL